MRFWKKSKKNPTFSSMKNDNRQFRILVLNGDSRNGLAIIRSLGSKGYRCDYTADNTSINRSLGSFFKSRYAENIHFLPQIGDETHFLSGLSDILKENDYDYIIPAGTQHTNFLSKYKDTLTEHSNPLVEDYEKIWQLHNKKECIEWFLKLGIPVPETHIIQTYKDLEYASKKIDYPVIIKNIDSFASQGLWTCETGGEKLIRGYTMRNPKIMNGFSESYEFPMIQRKIAGDLIDSTAFSVDGCTVGLLTQERVVTAWLDGGGGLANITNDIDEVKRHTRHIIREIKWTGPIEMDWIREKNTGRFYALEINPKFWGTTQLTISSGLDYPAMLVGHARGERIEGPSAYTQGLMCRWVADELHAILTQSVSRKRLFSELRAFLSRFNHPNAETDIWIDDIRPVFRNILSLAGSYLKNGGILNTVSAILNRREKA